MGDSTPYGGVQADSKSAPGIQKFDNSYFDERAAEIAASFSYDGYRIVRREMFAHMRVPAVTIRYDSITFNTACIEGLEDAVYIQIMVSQNQKRIAIRKRDENDKDALRWCIAKPDKRKSRKISGREFSKMIYDMMDWNRSCRYKVTGHKIFFEGEYLYVFELNEPEIFHERPKRTKKQREELEQTMSAEELAALKKKEAAASRKPFYPDDVEGTFGLPVNEHEDKVSLGDPSTFHGMKEFMEEEADTASLDPAMPSNLDQGEMNSQESGVESYEGSVMQPQPVSGTQTQDHTPAESVTNHNDTGGSYGYHG